MLLCSTNHAWLNTCERRRVNGFQNRCLRCIWGIKPAYISRVSNLRVLEASGQKPLTRSLEKQQLLLYGRVARQSDGTLMRDATFCPGSFRPATERFVRKVGRPRMDWASEVGKLAVQAAGGLQQLKDRIEQESVWRTVVETFYNRS